MSFQLVFTWMSFFHFDCRHQRWLLHPVFVNIHKTGNEYDGSVWISQSGRIRSGHVSVPLSGWCWLFVIPLRPDGRPVSPVIVRPVQRLRGLCRLSILHQRLPSRLLFTILYFFINLFYHKRNSYNPAISRDTQSKSIMYKTGRIDKHIPWFLLYRWLNA